MTYQQLWYVTRVYPEAVTAEQAENAWDKAVKTPTGPCESYWKSALKIVKALS